MMKVQQEGAAEDLGGGVHRVTLALEMGDEEWARWEDARLGRTRWVILEMKLRWEQALR